MSRHHITPPAIYAPPPPKPKETRRRRGVGYAQGSGAASEADETEQSSGISQTSPQHGAPAVPQHQVPVEAAERRLHSTTGKLSEGTLKAMLEAQEKAER
ncbi:MAG TPA: hypothetical protein VMM15_15260 [Bradyrhizobium sp.]|nr:hypothetical protein [Bradyrhizobium sp.]